MPLLLFSSALPPPLVVQVQQPIAPTGSSDDITGRVKGVIPRRWWAWVAPIYAALLGGISDQFTWGYAWITYARQQSRIATSSGIFLDIIAYDFLGRFLGRKGTTDSAFRAQITATILKERVTRAGMVNALSTLTGSPPKVFEPWNTFDTGAIGVAASGLAIGQGGGWGSMQLPGQIFLQVRHGIGPLTPNVAGIGSYLGGIGVGSIEYISPNQEAGSVNSAQIYTTIQTTKPSGVIVWTAIL
jgi:hypothetical protein